jgi:hypothetical protein
VKRRQHLHIADCVHEIENHALTLVAIVIVLVPIAFGVPAMFVFIPPAVLLAPASFAHCLQLTTFVIGALAVASVFFNGAVKFMLFVNDPALASVDIFCMKLRNCGRK